MKPRRMKQANGNNLYVYGNGVYGNEIMCLGAKAYKIKETARRQFLLCS